MFKKPEIYPKII